MGSLKFPAYTKQLFQLVILDMSATRLTALVSLFICSFSVTSACQAVHLFGLLSITRQFLFALAQIRAGVLTKGGGKSGCQSSEGKRERQRSKTRRGGMGYLLSQNDASLCRRYDERGSRSESGAVSFAGGLFVPFEEVQPKWWASVYGKARRSKQGSKENSPIAFPLASHCFASSIWGPAEGCALAAGAAAHTGHLQL